MSIFTRIGAWLTGIFNRTRPGLLQFWHAHEAQAVDLVKRYLVEFAGTPMNEWRSKAFTELSGTINSTKQHPDTFVSSLLELAHDIAKQEQANPGA